MLSNSRQEFLSGQVGADSLRPCSFLPSVLSVWQKDREEEKRSRICFALCAVNVKWATSPLCPAFFAQWILSPTPRSLHLRLSKRGRPFDGDFTKFSSESNYTNRTKTIYGNAFSVRFKAAAVKIRPYAASVQFFRRWLVVRSSFFSSLGTVVIVRVKKLWFCSA